MLTHAESSLEPLREALKAFVTKTKPLGYVPEYVALEETSWVAEEQASVLAVDFASSAASELADKLNLTGEAFDGVEPSGVTGYTVGDVRRIGA